MSIEAIKFQHIEYFNEFIYKLQRDAYKINQDKITLKGITKINGTNVSLRMMKLDYKEGTYY